MATIRYTKTNFEQPAQISEEQYLALKSVLSENPNFNIDPNPETFSEHFSSLLQILKFCGVAIIAGFILAGAMSNGRDGALFTIGSSVSGIGCFVGFFVGFSLLLDGPSFATYVKAKDYYFNTMKMSILTSSSYAQYIKIFNENYY